MNKKMLFVLNPTSGKGQIKGSFLEIVDLFVSNDWDVQTRTTQCRDDAYEYVRNHGKDFEMVVVAGGDGTLSEAIRGLMALKRSDRPVLGYIPAGSTNDFASNMKISKDMLEAAKGVMDGRPFKCDIGTFNGKNFIYVAAFGAFTDVSYDTSQQMKNVLGHSAYIIEGAKRLPKLKTYKMKVAYDGGVYEDEFLYGSVSNTNYIAGLKAEKAFEAQFNDGLLEVVLVKKPQNVLQFQQLLMKLVARNLDYELFITFKTDKVVFEAEEEVSWTLDGEFGGSVERAEMIDEKEAITLLLNDE
ncbi:MAG: diacylglycerol kinase family lipid kinase [Clostridia bacterium]|nr:diacylglycerol kinase family lipid kinase [Clostridia bacterium]